MFATHETLRLGCFRLAQHSWVLLAASWLCACALGSLTTGDVPRPTLGPKDPVTFSPPTCVVIPASRNALATQQRTLTVSARRVNGLGAESVPVSFRLGKCEKRGSVREDAGVGREASQGGTGGAGGATGAATADRCATPPNDVDPSYLNHFGLSILDSARCTSPSTTVINCVLDATGSMSVAVRWTPYSGDGGVTDQLSSAPLCVELPVLQLCDKNCADQGGLRPDFYTREIALLTAEDELPLSSGFVELMNPPISNDCGLGVGCTDERTIGTFQVGLSSSDVPLGQPLSGRQILAPNRDLPLQVTLSASNRTYRLTDRGCGAAPSMPVAGSSAASSNAGASEAGTRSPSSDASAAGNGAANGGSSQAFKLNDFVTQSNPSKTFQVCGDSAGGALDLRSLIDNRVSGFLKREEAPELKALSSAADGTFRIQYCNDATSRVLMSKEIALVHDLTDPAHPFLPANEVFTLDQIPSCRAGGAGHTGIGGSGGASGTSGVTAGTRGSSGDAADADAGGAATGAEAGAPGSNQCRYALETTDGHLCSPR